MGTSAPFSITVTPFNSARGNVSGVGHGRIWLSPGNTRTEWAIGQRCALMHYTLGSYNKYEPKKCGSQRSDQLL